MTGMSYLGFRVTRCHLLLLIKAKGLRKQSEQIEGVVKAGQRMSRERKA